MVTGTDYGKEGTVPGNIGDGGCLYLGIAFSGQSACSAYVSHRISLCPKYGDIRWSYEPIQVLGSTYQPYVAAFPAH